MPRPFADNPPPPLPQDFRDRARCLACGYPLKLLESGRCPECGHRFNRYDPSTVWLADRPQRRKRDGNWGRWVVPAAMCAVALTGEHRLIGCASVLGLVLAVIWAVRWRD